MTKVKTHYYKNACRCGSKIMSKEYLTNEMMKNAGWTKFLGSWYCDECEPYKEEPENEDELWECNA